MTSMSGVRRIGQNVRRRLSHQGRVKERRQRSIGGIRCASPALLRCAMVGLAPAALRRHPTLTRYPHQPRRSVLCGDRKQVFVECCAGWISVRIHRPAQSIRRNFPLCGQALFALVCSLRRSSRQQRPVVAAIMPVGRMRRGRMPRTAATIDILGEQRWDT